MLIVGDLSQLEWRIAAWLSQDPVMIQEILDKVDQHERVRSDPNLFDGKVDRVIAKNFNFRQIYADERSAAYAYYMDPRMPRMPKKDWEKVVGGFYQKYSRFSQWHNEIYRSVVINNGLLVSPTGRRYHFTKVKKRNGFEYNKAMIYNYPVQGMAGGEVLPLQMIQLDRKLKERRYEAKVVNTVHDNVIVDAPKKEVDSIVELWYDIYSRLHISLSKFFGIDFNVPLAGEISVGPTWGTQVKV